MARIGLSAYIDRANGDIIERGVVFEIELYRYVHTYIYINIHIYNICFCIYTYIYFTKNEILSKFLLFS